MHFVNKCEAMFSQSDLRFLGAIESSAYYTVYLKLTTLLA